VLYLAEVQKKTSFVGIAKTELKLLACQRSADNWSAVANEEVVPTDESSLKDGALVLVELSSNKQIQKVEEAGRRLVSTLQGFSRMQEKFKEREDEIEQWKQSLTYQSHELNRREMEMDTRREQLQQLEEDFEQLEQQRQELNATREEVNRSREELDRSRQELEGAWEHLRGEMRRLEEQRSEISGQPSLDPSQASRIQELLGQLTDSFSQTDSIREQLNLSFEASNACQAYLDEQRQRLEAERAEAQAQENQLNQQRQDFQRQWQEWQEAQAAYEQARGALDARRDGLAVREGLVQSSAELLERYAVIHQQIYDLADVSDQVIASQKIDLTALESMPIEELQSIVHDLQQEYDKTARFVNDQEEELRDKQQVIEELKAQIEQASEYDRLTMENELNDEQESYKLLDEALIGQRRTLREREEVLNLHRMVLDRRRGAEQRDDADRGVDLRPVLTAMSEQLKQQEAAVEQGRQEVERLRAELAPEQEALDQQAQAQEAAKQELWQKEEALMEQQRLCAEHWGKVRVYEELLQAVQDRVGSLQQKLESLAGILAQIQESSGQHGQLIAEVQGIIQGLMG